MAYETAIGPAEERRDQFGRLYQFSEIFPREIAIINERRRQRAAERGEVTLDIEIAQQAGELTVDIEAEAQPGVTALNGEGRELRGEIRLEIEAEDVAKQPVLTPAADANVVGLALSGGGIRSAAFCLGVLQALDAEKVLEQVDYMSTVSGGGYIGCSLTACLEQSGSPWSFPYTSRLKEDEPLALQHIRDYSNYLFPHGGALLRNAAIYARGLAVNSVLLGPFLLGASALTLLLYWLRCKYPQLHIGHFVNPFALPHFFVTLDLAIILAVVGIAWGLYRSTKGEENAPEIPGGWAGSAVGGLAILVFIVAFCETQPLLLALMMEQHSGNLFYVMPIWIKAITAALTPVAAAVTFLASKVGDFIKSTRESTKLHAQIAGIVMKGLIYVAGLIIPLGIWMIYLGITYWGLSINGIIGAGQPTAWQPATIGYCVGAIVCFLIALFMRSNANSLHPLYRDRLAKAFIFNLQPQNDHLERWRPKLSEISSLHGPYYLINAALNVQDSKTANRRGRNADFFIFSSQFVGSKSTGYAATVDAEDVAIGLDLATAMAVSGAAVSSNMGAQSIKPLTASMALLNLRLGYWMRNPNQLQYAKAAEPGQRFRRLADFSRKRNPFANYYFLAEMFGLLSDRFKSVYLTDGGHIENLGIYELLRRRCRVIIAVDAEADSQMAFASFNTLERYALIDMGIRIDLPWQRIANESLATGKAIDETGDAEKHHGPHCAIGEITYPNDRKGILVYIKASLTGDENDYIFDYKKRYSDFPHETTLDQMFTEEQFEAYRALGFHAAYRLFDGSDTFAHLHLDENSAKVRAQVAFLNELFGLAGARIA